MEIEGRPGRRLIRPALITALVLVSLVLPTWLWVVRGRSLPLQVMLDPPVYVVQAGARVPLRLLLLPASARGDVALTWRGPGIIHASDPAQTAWTAPTRPGTYSVTVTARRSRSKAQDSVTFQVLARDPDTLHLARPASVPPLPLALPRCTGRPPTVTLPTGEPTTVRPTGKPPMVTLHGTPCAGATVVVQAVVQGTAKVWHQLGGGHEVTTHHGAWAELVLPRDGPWPTLTTTVVPDGASCAWVVRTTIDHPACRGGPSSGPVFADFAWQLVGPGYFRFTAKPSRTPGVRFVRYRWDFGDGTTSQGKAPQTTHHFKSVGRENPPGRYHLVWLEVAAGDGTRVESLRLVLDRTAE